MKKKTKKTVQAWIITTKRGVPVGGISAYDKVSTAKFQCEIWNESRGGGLVVRECTITYEL